MLSVIIPALNESQTIGQLIDLCTQNSIVDEVIVVDDGSIDRTVEISRKHGARVITSSLLGKGASMRDGALVARNDCLLYLDADLIRLDPDVVSKLSTPILEGRADLVKARFDRYSGGRVTRLTALPLLAVFFPELAAIEQPLGGVIATTRSLILALDLEDDYGVDVGILIDASHRNAVVQQVDIGRLSHKSQPIESLGKMATQVVRTILNRATKYDRLHKHQLELALDECQVARKNLDDLLDTIRESTGLVLIDMDGTLVNGRFIEYLADFSGQSNVLLQFLDNTDMLAHERTKLLSATLAGLSRTCFETTAMSLPLTAGAIDLVMGFRKQGYIVGIVSDSFSIATEIVRRRVFADFSIAHSLEFRGGVATGGVELAPMMFHESGCKSHLMCKYNLLRHLQDRLQNSMPPTIAIGDNIGDSCLIKGADVGIAFEPKSVQVSKAANFTIRGNISGVLTKLNGTVCKMSS